MKDFLEFMIRSIVDKPEQVRVNEIIGEQLIVYEVSVADGEVGKVIGRHGQTARSIRILLGAAAGKQGKRAVLEIIETRRH